MKLMHNQSFLLYDKSFSMQLRKKRGPHIKK